MVGLLWIAYKRLRGQPWLALLSALGMALAVGLAVSVPVFAQAVGRAIMEDELEALSAQVGRSPLALRVYLLPSSKSPITAQQCQDASAAIAAIYASNLGIPARSHQVTVESAGLMLKTAQDGSYGKAGAFLGNVKAGFLPGIGGHMHIVSGEPMGATAPGETLNAWMYESWAMELGITPGEQFVIQPILQPLPIKVRIAGTWQPEDAQDPFWPSAPDAAWRTTLLVLPEDYATRVEPFLGDTPVGFVSWAVNLDERRFVPELADRYLRGFQRAEVVIQQLLPGARCDVSPLPVLEAFIARRRPLTLLLFGFSVPIIGFLLYFLTLVSGMVVESQRQDTATMVSRGMDPGQLTLVSLCEGLFLLALSAPLGVGVGLGVARIMGHSQSFLRFAPGSPLHVSLVGTNPWLILPTMGVALLARLWPVLRRGHWSIVEHSREFARPQRVPVWLWLYADLLLVAPTAYAYRQLQQQGTIVLLRWRSSGDIFQDPVLFLVPVLFMLAASLVGAQLFPLLLRLADHFISTHLSLVGCLTLRQLGRQGAQYVSSLLLIMASLSVGVFVASMAASLDQWLVDRVHYRLGADIAFRLENTNPLATSSSGPPSPGPEPGNAGAWLVPWDRLLGIPGVRGATTVGSYRVAVPMTPNSIVSGRFLAVDRSTFPTAAVFRPDFAAESLGELMNRLALHPDGVLVSRQFLARSSLTIGDPLKIKLSPDGTTEVDLPLVIVGAFDYFPTVYEDDSPTIVGSLDHLLTVAGGVGTYEIWLRADPARVARDQLPHALSAAVSYYSRYADVWTLVQEEQERNERIGVYGTLTIGFLASLALSGVGLLMQYHRSLRERLFRFAALRAIGISRGQVVAQVQLEYLLVLAAGILAGVFIGVEASRLFIPYFRVSTPDGRLPLPPLLLLLDRQSILAMAVTFALVQMVAQGGLIRRAMGAELFEVLRMGSQE